MEAKILRIVEGYEGIMESMKGLINPNAYIPFGVDGTLNNVSTARSPVMTKRERDKLDSNDAYGTIGDSTSSG